MLINITKEQLQQLIELLVKERLNSKDKNLLRYLQHCQENQTLMPNSLDEIPF